MDISTKEILLAQIRAYLMLARSLNSIYYVERAKDVAVTLREYMANNTIVIVAS